MAKKLFDFDDWVALPTSSGSDTLVWTVTNKWQKAPICWRAKATGPKVFRQYTVMFHDVFSLFIQGEKRRSFPTEVDAKAAAQADYEDTTDAL